MQARDGLAADAARLGQVLDRGDAAAGGMVPGLGFWSQPADALHRAFIAAAAKQPCWSGCAGRYGRRQMFM